MGHLAGKDLYKKVVNKVDALTIRIPFNDRVHAIVKEIFSDDEADLYVKMPYTLSDADRLARVTGQNKDQVRKVLDGMCEKGLVVDMWVDDRFYYMPSPMAVGIFEFTMMRTRGEMDMKLWGELFHQYLSDGSMYEANFSNGEKVSLLRALPHEDSLADYVEVLDYEKARSIVENTDDFAIGTCSCRHEKFHAQAKECEHPLDTCSTLGYAADYLVRHGMGKRVEKSQMLENLDRSRELGLVLQADNVQKSVTAICHCCGCCCNVLLGFNHFGFENALVTSSFLAKVNDSLCNGCGKCAKACPIGAIEMEPDTNQETKRKKQPVINNDVCIGCGVCGLKCKPQAVQLHPRKQRVIHPETAFERVVLMCLERGTLQNQIFDDANSWTHKTMGAFVGAFLRLSPVKKALMSDALRSTFLSTLRTGIRAQGKGWMLEL